MKVSTKATENAFSHVWDNNLIFIIILYLESCRPWDQTQLKNIPNVVLLP